MRQLKIIIATMTAFMMSTLMLSTANADVGADSLSPSPDSASTDEVSESEYRALFGDLERSDVPRSEETVEGVRQVSFEIDDFVLTLADPESVQIEPMLGGGIDSTGWYVTLNRTDQSAVLAGGGVALGAAICLIPAVGQIACAASGVIIAVAGVYLNEHGRCPGTMKLNLVAGPKWVPSCI